MDRTILNRPLAFQADSRTYHLYYREEGEGFPVLLLHGLAEDGAIWELQTNHLKHICRVIVPDLPGSGGSSLLPGEPSIDAMADALLELCDHAGIEKCIMIGHSMGGYTALAFAEKYPGRLKAFGLFHSTTYADSEERVATRKKMIGFIEKNGSPAYIQTMMPTLLAEATRKERPSILEGLIERYSNFPPESLMYYQEAMIRRPDRTDVLRRFEGPVHFLIGSQDATVPPEHSLQQCHIPALSQVDIIEGSAHMAMLEDSNRTNMALTSFITFTLQTWTRSS